MKCFPELVSRSEVQRDVSQANAPANPPANLNEEQKTSLPTPMKSKYSHDVIDEAVQIANFHNNNVFAADTMNGKYGTALNESTIRYWRNLRTEKNELIKSRKKTQRRRKKARFPHMEKLLLTWFTDCREKAIAISMHMILSQAKLLEVDPNFKASRGE
jgi:hypothetical protein